jgi:hypothetical protein
MDSLAFEVGSFIANCLAQVGAYSVSNVFRHQAVFAGYLVFIVTIVPAASVVMQIVRAQKGQ